MCVPKGRLENLAQDVSPWGNYKQVGTVPLGTAEHGTTGFPAVPDGTRSFFVTPTQDYVLG